MEGSIEKKRLAILRVLREHENQPIGSHEITKILKESGYDISERTVRFHLLNLDNEGFSRYLPKKGRKITSRGVEELTNARVYEKVGFLSSKIDRMTYLMHFDLAKREGTVVINTSLIDYRYLKKASPLIQKVFKAGFAMGRLLTLFAPGEKAGDLVIPDGFVGIGTVCSITINGVLLSLGIPTKSLFGGLLEVCNNQAARFVAIINYNGTSLDPLEIFIKSGMTNYRGAIQTGNGLIGASFREMPEESRMEVIAVAKELDTAGLGAFMEIGFPGKPLCEIPVGEGSFGSIIIGGLNPLALVEESGIEVHSKALSCLVDFGRLFSYDVLDEEVRGILP